MVPKDQKLLEVRKDNFLTSIFLLLNRAGYLKRVFLFCVNNFEYEKKDLNIPYSEKRTSIGLISRMITNAIFLSHKLRQDLLVRIYVAKPNPHYYQIDSSTIRYLGPEMRSSASILLKAEKYAINYFDSNEDVNSLKWHMPNPGLQLRFSNNLFADLELTNHESLMIISESNIQTKRKILSLENIENILSEITKRKPIFLFNIDVDLSRNDFIQNKFASEIISTFKPDRLSFASIVSLINIILDSLDSS
ncbi:MAG: hypothetical protein FK733_08255 [Asgard group archaeon]|nr:hypothetical protein [Asgard group archaeon]